MFLGLDIGTTGIKALVVNENGEVLDTFYRNLNIISKKPGWIEQNPEEWWENTESILEEVTKKYKINAISTSGQMHSLVVLDKNDTPLYNSILWSDQRTFKEVEYANEKLGGEDKVLEILGNPILTGFTLPKLLWLKNNNFEIYKNIDKIMLPKDYINYKLTGVHSTDFSDASGTAIYSIKERNWSNEVLEVFDINEKILPKIINSNEIISTVKYDETVVVAGGADNACSALGIGVIEEETMISIGTSGTVLKPIKNGNHDKRIHLFEHVVPGIKYYMGVMLSATNTFNWFRENFIIEDFKEINKNISKVSPGSNGVIVLPYLNGERTPHNDPYAKGIIFGLSTFNSKWDVLRAIYEGVSFGLRDSLELIKGLDQKIGDITITGGGTNSIEWMNILADITGHNLIKPKINEGAAYGAAMLAYSGYYKKDLKEIAKKWIKYNNKITYKKENKINYDKIYEKYKKLYKANKDLFK
ncbi:xylulokinase [Marinitoga sp. 38H-ov]|uniref:xylulokinase n=1 Tax=Marinitoga sp. 38H-ov TaxID=1755814 RepID=UPI0016B1492D|nr:xylulokinase [Marinitoga sp. 38H-ov]KAF2956772.1 xylulose kinase [Marinitoga sp. 38H-ov]